MSNSSPNLHRLPPPVRAALELTAHYLTRQALPEVFPKTSAAELSSVLGLIRESISCRTLLEELPPVDRQVLRGRDLPFLASELAHARIRGGEISTYPETLPDHECFLHGDPVWIPLRTRHALRGLTATFLHYTDPRIDHIQRQARIRLASEGYETTLVRPELLAFAPEAFIEGGRL